MFGCSVVDMVLCQLELGYYLPGLGLKRDVAGSLSNWVGVQSARVWVMCGGSGPWGKYNRGSICINW